MNTLARSGRITGLGAGAALAVALTVGCGSNIAEAPDQGHLTVIDSPKHQPHAQTTCPDAPDVVLRRTAHEVPDCEKPAEGGYPGAAVQPMG
jgi:hypothetical protein